MATPPDVIGTEIPTTGRLFNMLQKIFTEGENECNIPIMFKKSDEGLQQNDVHEMLINFFETPKQSTGMAIAKHLRSFTTNKSKLGLLFLISGKNEQGDDKFIVSRFPAEEGVIADTDQAHLKVEFIERIFMKSSRLYKAALYYGTNLRLHFWYGYATDKQVNSSANDIAQYWIHDFLSSDYRTTSKEGSRRLGIALKAVTNSDLSISDKQKLISFGVLVSGYDKQIITIERMMNELNLGTEMKQVLISHLSDPDLAKETFEFNSDEFFKYVSYKLIELDNKAILMAPSKEFKNCFHKELIDEYERKYRFTSEGSIIDEKLRARK